MGLGQAGGVRAGAESPRRGAARATGRARALAEIWHIRCRRDQKYSQWEFPDWIPLEHKWTCLSERYHWSSVGREGLGGTCGTGAACGQAGPGRVRGELGQGVWVAPAIGVGGERGHGRCCTPSSLWWDQAPAGRMGISWCGLWGSRGFGCGVLVALRVASGRACRAVRRLGGCWGIVLCWGVTG